MINEELTDLEDIIQSNDSFYVDHLIAGNRVRMKNEVKIKPIDEEWRFLQVLSPECIRAGDLDDDPRDDVIADFGPPYGVWIYANETAWSRLHALSPEGIIIGDLDHADPERDEVIVDFGNPHGLWVKYNNSHWKRLHSMSP